MIYDGFLFYNEFELLEIRLHELENVVDKFILVESDITFSGKPKKLMFYENIKSFKRFLPKIVHVPVFDTPATRNPWDREIFQRNAIMRGVPRNAPDSDLLITADVDEIPRASTLKELSSKTGSWLLAMNCYSLYLNAYLGIWTHAPMAPLSQYRKSTPHAVRSAGHATADNAGWHFTYMGGADKVCEKFGAFSHQEEAVQKWNNRAEIERKLEQKKGLFGGDMKVVDVDSTFPEHVQKNLDRFKHLIAAKT